MRRLTFWVPGKPGTFRSSFGRGRFISPEGRQYRHDLVAHYRLAARAAGPSWALDGSYHGRVGLILAVTGSSADWDNLGKEAADALQGSAYADDRQIVSAKVAILDRQLNPSGNLLRPKRPCNDIGIMLTLILWD